VQKSFLVLLLVIFYPFCPCSCATYFYDYSENCRKAYQNYMSLHIREGRIRIIDEMKSNPYNLMATFISDYEDCIVLLMNCDRSDYRQRAGHLDDRIELLDKGDRSSPWYRFCKAGVYLHWALVNTRFGEQYKAAINFHRSFELLKDNKRLFPDFEYNNVFGGLQEAVVGSLPGNYKWLASIFGIKGSVKKGTEQLLAFITDHSDKQPLDAECVLYYLLTRFYLLSEQKQAWEFINSPQFPTHGNLLNAFAKATIALDFRKSDAAMEAVNDAMMDSGCYMYPIFYYQMGVAKLYKLDTACVGYFRQYLKNNKSDLFIKDSWQKMAFSCYLSGNKANAAYCMSQVLSKGYSRIDADKQAAGFSEKGLWPPMKLLEARLLIEGGYNSRALVILQNIDTAQLQQPADKAEYLFRLGRVYQESEDNTRALEYYQATINKGKSRHEQFAARAALQMGSIYEHSGMADKAGIKYRECLSMPAHDFQNSIDQQAKAGINRVEAGIR
jgi:tetratricopeptide (TPR) repeat protein